MPYPYGGKFAVRYKNRRRKSKTYQNPYRIGRIDRLGYRKIQKTLSYARD